MKKNQKVNNEFLFDYFNYKKSIKKEEGELSSEITDNDIKDLYDENFLHLASDSNISFHNWENPFYNQNHLPGGFDYPFYNFYTKFNSLYRYWYKYNKDIKEYFKYFEKFNIESAEEELLFSEVEIDKDFFYENLKNFIITMNLSLLENFLNDITKEVGNKMKIENLNSTSKTPPIPDKYIIWLKNECKFKGLEQNKINNKKWDAIRTIRNRFIHSIDRSIPLDVKDTLDKIHENLNTNEINSDIFVEFVFFEISELVKKIQESYFSKFNNY